MIYIFFVWSCTRDNFSLPFWWSSCLPPSFYYSAGCRSVNKYFWSWHHQTWIHDLVFVTFINVLKVISFPLGLSVPGIPSALASLGVGHSGMAAAAAAAASRLGLSGLAATGGHNVLLVSNLNPEVSTLTGLKQVCILSLFLQCWAALDYCLEYGLCETSIFCPIFSIYHHVIHKLNPFLKRHQVRSPTISGPLCLTEPAAFLTCHFAHCEF